MPITIKHQKVSTVADDPTSAAAGKVLPSDWNATHTLTLGYGSFFDTTDQTLSAATATVINFNNTNLSNGVTLVSSNRITMAAAGVYDIQFSLQYRNTDTSDQDVDVWFRKNGVDIANSNSRFAVAAKHGSINGHIIAALNIFVDCAANDYIQLVHSTDASTIRLEHFVAGTSPTRPAIPSVILTVNQVY